MYFASGKGEIILLPKYYKVKTDAAFHWSYNKSTKHRNMNRPPFGSMLHS